MSPYISKKNITKVREKLETIREKNDAIRRHIRSQQKYSILIAFAGAIITILALVPFSSQLSYLIQKDQFDDVDSQLKKLDNIEDSLLDLDTFIEEQKRGIVNSKEALENLKNEKEQLESVLEADRETIEDIFQLQEQRLRQRVWVERGIGFFIGVLSSLVAAFIYSHIQKKKTGGGSIGRP